MSTAELVDFVAAYKGAIALWTTLIAGLLLAEVTLCAIPADEYGLWTLLLTVPTLLAFNAWSVYEMRDLPQLIRQNRRAECEGRQPSSLPPGRGRGVVGPEHPIEQQIARRRIAAMTNIAEFIQARLDEDERLARAASLLDDEGESWRIRKVRNEGMYVFGEHQVAPPGGRLGMAEDAQTEHIARHDPARALREVAALRAVVGRQAGEHRDDRGSCETCRRYDFRYDWDPVPWPCPTVRATASIWSDHPDYRPEWSVES